MTLHAMHLAAWLCSRVKFICHERGGVSGGLLPVLPDCRPVCGEPVRSGADKNSYVKCGGVAGSYFTHHVVTQTESREKKPSGRSRVVFYLFFCSSRSDGRSS